MFYSHEILTSPEHGVATIWLVATLGSRSITKKLNRRTILDVDVPKACGVIMDPVAPMALRLQGNLLYGVSRVYSQQCGYALTDVQAMHDKMRAMLRAIPGGGLDPSAGRARPEQLILPYDPSFLPENNLPGMGLDLSKLEASLEINLSQQSGLMWPKTPDLSQSALSQTQTTGLNLNLYSDDHDLVMRDAGGFSSDTNVSRYTGRNFDFGGIERLSLNEEGGVILQPDFEFDEDGNIVELAENRRDEERLYRMSAIPSERRLADEMKMDEINNLLMEDQELEVLARGEQSNRATGAPSPVANRASVFEPIREDEVSVEPSGAPMRQKRVPKLVNFDDQIALRNRELAHLNDNYIANMAAVSKQKLKNKLPTLAKKNAAFWVFGQGIGSVGVGVGSYRVSHPLELFSGEQLKDALDIDPETRGKKRVHASIEEGDPDFDRCVRPRLEDEEQIGRAHDGELWNEDVEIGRHAPSALRDDSSIQMPWNITASLQSSRQGSSAANVFRGLGSVSDFSSHGFPDAGLRRPRSRLTSASPLAARGYPFDIDGLNRLSIPGNQDDDTNLDDFDLSQYLHTEVATDNERVINDNPMADTHPGTIQLDDSQTSSLDQESLNFFDFLTTKLAAVSTKADGECENETGSPREIEPNETSFTGLLPPQKTSRIVATQGLMHVLTLATRGILSVHQDPYEDLSSEEYGVRYQYGEIHLSIPGL
ncbi:Rad21/Rec8 N terminal domain protein [Aspergillus heteromorphus CBS 117.55]|uniref:Rad21/Rec8 N terminal domain protein n=1 Tax=Aspergillus heteromorphus CBS 117.55 TaxID=1448321 RepID=A0A317WGU8_9EURO|nr:Rad21/Rec8 N terminal domain protein [Aspergillus heteromorphus CBS 117.55]PWY83430.1 Rad21/Rec8 N terminal domain protein [Aspergillus heteromorphus CBS 117.55]